MKKKMLLFGLIISFACVTMFAADAEVKSSGQKANAGGFDGSRPNQLSTNLKQVGRFVLMYIPNRVIDTTDIFTMEVGFGGVFAGEFLLTRYMQFGGEHGASYFLSKGYARQYGGGYRQATHVGMFCWMRDVSYVENTFGTARSWVIDNPSFGLADWQLDAYRDRDVDFWAIGGRFGWLMDFAFGVHPLEIADTVLGFFCYDLMDDDLK